MNMDHLYYFKTLVETKSRTETAEKLAITPSTLSLAISKLERELNTTLIDKKRGSVALTTEGEVFYEYIATALRFVEGGVKILNERGEGTSQSEIVIGTVFSAQDKDWSNIISKFRNYTHGGVRIKVKQATTPDLLNAIKNGTVDLALCGTMGKDSDISFIPIWSQRAVLVVNQLHPFAKRNSISLAELKDHYLISYNLTGPLANELTNLVKDYSLLIDYLYSDEITLASIVAGNPDIIAIACRSWLLDSYHNEVKLINIKEAPDNFHQMFLCTKASIYQPQAVETFIDIVKRYCEEKKNHLHS